MKSLVLEDLERQWPGRYALYPHEVALVLRGRSTVGIVQTVREKMMAGDYGVCYPLDGKRYMLSLSVLADYIVSRRPPFPRPRPVGQSMPHRSGSRRIRNIGPRPGING